MFNLHASIFTTHYTISGPRKLPLFVLNKVNTFFHQSCLSKIFIQVKIIILI